MIPLGTANVLAHELALPFAPRAVAAALAFGRTRPLWPGVARGADGSRLFVQMLGVGFDAQVVHRLPVPLKRVFGRGAYVLQTLRELGALCAIRRSRVRLDDEETQAASVIVSKGRFYGGRLPAGAGRRPADPGFSVVLFSHAGTAAALMYGAALPLDVLGPGAGRAACAGAADRCGRQRGDPRAGRRRSRRDLRRCRWSMRQAPIDDGGWADLSLPTSAIPGSRTALTRMTTVRRMPARTECSAPPSLKRRGRPVAIFRDGG